MLVAMPAVVTARHAVVPVSGRTRSHAGMLPLQPDCGTSAHVVACSSVHVAEQPSPSAVLPSSQASPVSTCMLPHTGHVDAGDQSRQLSLSNWPHVCSTPASHTVPLALHSS